MWKKYAFLWLFLVIVLLYNYFNSSTFTDDIKANYLPKEISGKIYNLNLVKGGSLSINIHTQEKDDGITLRNSEYVFNNIRKGYFFKKIAGSNKCYIIKGDSIMYFNCYIFSKEDSAKIGKVLKWKENITNKWIKK
ncbi:hypothetical protein [Epilithonimonas caeni]|uniref:hypothetical protein n=1 Tax=Epilithonimonas caeni TaxID=365343 RepID=UPI00041F9D33|nr:hypothetical protein [Epilithonimonas caeni]